MIVVHRTIHFRRMIVVNVEHALSLVADGMTLGLGSGQAAEAFITALGERVRGGLAIRGVPTSSATAALAARVGIPLVELRDAIPIDMTFDGADEVDPDLNLLKGFGNALVREKIVAAASKVLVILIGPGKVREKLVPALGHRGSLPVEALPFALPLVERRVAELGYPADIVRAESGQPLLSDNGNLLLRLKVQSIPDAAALEAALRAIPGIVGTGLFLGMAHRILIDDGGTLTIRERNQA
jgi:ribose 5-phosphate isomerase A